MPSRLTSFTIDNDGDDYVIRLESEGGEPLELAATYDQLDLISETIDEKLNADEETALEVETE